MFKKILLAILICCMMISIIPTATLAAQPEIIQPMWTNTTSFTINMFFSGNTGSFTVYVFGKTGVTNISLNVQLYYKNAAGSWVKTNESWQYSANQMYLSVTDTFDAVHSLLIVPLINITIIPRVTFPKKSRNHKFCGFCFLIT